MRESTETAGYRRKPPDFISLPELLARRLAGIQEVTAARVFFVTNKKHWTDEERDEMEKDTDKPLDWSDKMTYAEERENLAKALAGDGTAVESLLKANLPVIQALAELLSEKPQIQDELVQIGMLRLSRAIKKYKLSYRIRLIRFAMKSIFCYMERYAMRQDTTSNLYTTLTAHAKIQKLIGWKDEGTILSRKAKMQGLRLKDNVNNSVEGDHNYRFALLEHMAFGSPEEPADDNNLRMETPRMEDLLTGAEMASRLDDDISKREAEVLSKLYGLHSQTNPDCEKLQVNEISLEMNLSRSQVGRILAAALVRLHHQVTVKQPVTSDTLPSKEGDAFFRLLRADIKELDSQMYERLKKAGWRVYKMESAIKLVSDEMNALYNEQDDILNKLSIPLGEGESDETLQALRTRLNEIRPLLNRQGQIRQSINRLIDRIKMKSGNKATLQNRSSGIA